MKRALIAGLALLAVSSVSAQTLLQLSPLGWVTVVPVCHDYDCANETDVVYHETQLDEVARVMAVAQSAAEERERLALVIGQLYAWAGRQSPIWRDKAGNHLDDGMPGTMDCIDHSTTTTRFLLMMQQYSMLRFHRVIEPAWRGIFLTQHRSAAIEEVEPDLRPAESDGSGQFVVDSWYGDNGTPALVIPIEAWREGGGPDV